MEVPRVQLTAHSLAISSLLHMATEVAVGAFTSADYFCAGYYILVIRNKLLYFLTRTAKSFKNQKKSKVVEIIKKHKYIFSLKHK